MIDTTSSAYVALLISRHHGTRSLIPSYILCLVKAFKVSELMMGCLIDALSQVANTIRPSTTVECVCAHVDSMSISCLRVLTVGKVW